VPNEILDAASTFIRDDELLPADADAELVHGLFQLAMQLRGQEAAACQSVATDVLDRLRADDDEAIGIVKVVAEYGRMLDPRLRKTLRVLALQLWVDHPDRRDELAPLLQGLEGAAADYQVDEGPAFVEAVLAQERQLHGADDRLQLFRLLLGHTTPDDPAFERRRSEMQASRSREDEWILEQLGITDPRVNT
jgi:hypothetical protein